MSLLRVTSPHASGQGQVSSVMRDVLIATLPGVLILTAYFGPGTLLNIVFGGLIAVATEYAITALRGRDPRVAISDLSILVTSTLLCIALPPYAPWWLIVIGVLTAVLLGKQVFGGLGYNPFNPAMVGYVVLLISFPVQMSSHLYHQRIHYHCQYHHLLHRHHQHHPYSRCCFQRYNH